MAQEPDTEALEMTIVSCATCDQLFLESPRRHTCPTCAGEAGLTFFRFSASPNGIRLLAFGHDLAPAAAPPQDVVVTAAGETQDVVVPFEPAPGEAVEEVSAVECAQDALIDFLAGEIGEEVPRQALLGAGAEADDAASAIGRILAVRQLLSRLQGAKTAANVRSDEKSPPPSQEGAPSTTAGPP